MLEIVPAVVNIYGRKRYLEDAETLKLTVFGMTIQDGGTIVRFDIQLRMRKFSKKQKSWGKFLNIRTFTGSFSKWINWKRICGNGCLAY